jgi:arginase
MLDLIGVPMDLCSARQGSRLGPSAVRLAGIQAVFEALGQEVCDRGDLPIHPEATEPHGIRNFAPATACHAELKKGVAKALKEGGKALVLGGDHSNATSDPGAKP